MNPSPLDNLIKFRKLISELSPTETDAFVSNLIAKFGNDFIITTISTYFITFQHESQEDNELNDITGLVTDIIESRSGILVNDVIFAVDELPPELIGKTASFLKTRDYLSFQQTNRNIYTGCNSPLQMHTLEIARDYQDISMIINWAKYTGIKSLGEVIFPDIIHVIQPFDDEIVFNNLDSLVIGFNCSQFTQSDVNEFSALKSINVKNIHRLTCRYIGSPHRLQDTPTFFSFLSAFTNLEYLELHSICLDDELLLGMEPELSPHIKGLQLSKCNAVLQIKLLQMYSDQIEILLVESKILRERRNSKAYVFPKLKILDSKQKRSSQTSLSRIVCSSKLLQSVTIHSLDFDSMVRLITPKHMRCLEILCKYRKFNKRCQIIIEVFRCFKQFNLKKNNLKIILCLTTDPEETKVIDVNIVTKSIKEIIDSLSDCSIKDFMVCCRAATSAWIEHSEEIIQQSNIFRNKYSFNFYDFDNSCGKMLVVNKINSQLTCEKESIM